MRKQHKCQLLVLKIYFTNLKIGHWMYVPLDIICKPIFSKHVMLTDAINTRKI